MFLIFCYVLFLWSPHDTSAECPLIVSRKEWNAVKPRKLNFIITPVDLVIIQHTVTEPCYNDQSCAKLVKHIQNTHLTESLLWDIGPSFLVGGNGKLYHGRGWRYTGIHTAGYNNQSISIAFIGNFNNEEPSPLALDAVKNLIQCGVEENLLTPNHKLVCHNQLIPTESPGTNLINKIKSWSDWTGDVSEIIKRADKQINQVLDLKPEPKIGLVLTTLKEIDFLSSIRDLIGVLINNTSNLAHQTLNTVDTLANDVNKEASLFINLLVSGLKKLSDQVGLVFSTLPGIPSVQQCAKPLKDKSKNLYDSTEAKAKSCADKRLKEIEEFKEALRRMSSETVDYTTTTIETTKNCTELNYGIESSTQTCLNSVIKEMENTFKNYETQRNFRLNSFNALLKALPGELDKCGRQPLTEAGIETTKIVADISNCAAKNIVPNFSGFIH